MSAANTDGKRKFGKKIRGKFNYILERASRLVLFMGQSWVRGDSENGRWPFLFRNANQAAEWVSSRNSSRSNRSDISGLISIICPDFLLTIKICLYFLYVISPQLSFKLKLSWKKAKIINIKNTFHHYLKIVEKNFKSANANLFADSS